ncbi:hypothetical protein EV356DRAFT_532892 [Viridothelium virens]|uniref:Uncharacterized protein n=1 Tax=Viridothelium virens TaxID=1048519 RepID=A0A6A6H9W5_VIRVR|nr:hypothetical protein EV356DRAFT_532892 [Viridothelium virens]
MLNRGTPNSGVPEGRNNGNNPIPFGVQRSGSSGLETTVTGSLMVFAGPSSPSIIVGGSMMGWRRAKTVAGVLISFGTGGNVAEGPSYTLQLNQPGTTLLFGWSANASDLSFGSSNGIALPLPTTSSGTRLPSAAQAPVSLFFLLVSSSSTIAWSSVVASLENEVTFSATGQLNMVIADLSGSSVLVINVDGSMTFDVQGTATTVSSETISIALNGVVMDGSTIA